MANICSWHARPRSCTPTSTRSTPRSSSATILACAAGRSSSARASCSPPATRPRRCGVRTAMGGAPGPAAVPRGDRGRAAHVGLLRGEQGGVRGVRGHDAAGRRACRSTRPSSTSAGWGGSRERPRRSPSGCGARCASGSGLPITVGVARTKFLAKVASGVAKPDGLLVVPPDGELDFLHPLPIERLWGVGPVTAEQAARPRDHDRRRGRPARRGGARVDARARVGPPPARARPQPRPAAGAGAPPAPVDRAAARARPHAEVARRARRGPRRPRRPRDAPPARRPGGSAARSCCGCASTTSPGPPARTPCPRPRPRPSTILATARGLLTARACR